MLAVGRDNVALTEYLIGQVLESDEKRFETLREFFPNVKEGDWREEVAGQRVQIIKKDPTHGGILQFGTEIVSAADRSLAAMLGASPGASTAVFIMLKVIERCFPDQLKSGWAAGLKEMIPSYGQSLINDAALTRRVHSYTAELLHINDVQLVHAGAR
jgi:malate dehydrogenase (quinone)